MKNKLDDIIDKMDNPLFSTINENDLNKLAKEYEEDK
jgi:hypothetical protein